MTKAVKTPILSAGPDAKRRWRTLGAVILTLAVGVGLAVGLQRHGLAPLDVVSLILVTLAVYLVASGQLAELTGPGGWRLKLRDLGAERVAVDASGRVEATDLEFFGKGSVGLLGRIEQDLRALNGAPFALTLKLGHGGYRPRALRDYLRLMMAFDPLVPVIFVEGGGRFQGSTLGLKLAAVLGDANSPEADDPDLAASSAIVAAIIDDDMARVQELVSITQEYVLPEETNREVLAKMLDQDVPLLIMLDRTDGRPTGIVKRDPLVAKMMTQLTAP